MKSYLCEVCGYIYIPEENNNVEFEKLPDTWRCPICQVGKEEFKKLD